MRVAQYGAIGSVRVNRDGTFDGSIPIAINPEIPVALIRLRALSRSSSNPRRSFSTYSIVRPTPLSG